MPFEELTEDDLDEIALLSIERAFAAEDEKGAKDEGAGEDNF